MLSHSMLLRNRSPMPNIRPPKTRPDRSITISDEWKRHPDGVIGCVRDAGFRMDGNNVAQPCRVTAHHGICIQIEQWN